MTRPSRARMGRHLSLLPSQGDHEIGLDVILVDVVVGAAAEGPHDELRIDVRSHHHDAALGAILGLRQDAEGAIGIGAQNQQKQIGMGLAQFLDHRGEGQDLRGRTFQALAEQDPPNIGHDRFVISGKKDLHGSVPGAERPCLLLAGR